MFGGKAGQVAAVRRADGTQALQRYDLLIEAKNEEYAVCVRACVRAKKLYYFIILMSQLINYFL